MVEYGSALLLMKIKTSCLRYKWEQFHTLPIANQSAELLAGNFLCIRISRSDFCKGY